VSKILTGHSLKEDSQLWESFQNLKSARNKFVHEGVARIGETIVTEAKAMELVNRVNDIIKWVRRCLPEASKWPEFEIPVNTQVLHSLIKVAEPG
jgi:hypothetical protein